MNTVNFLEMPKANIGDGNQDTFELFARDLAEDLGFKIIQGPGRGADAGRDMIVEECRTGVGGETTIRWLVSCKHYAHGRNSVGVDDELSILDRVSAARAKGFLAFYSTLPSAGLNTKLQELSPTIESYIFDRAKIENYLLKRDSGHRLFSRYFPISYREWSVANPRKPQLHFKEEVLACEYCSKDLLQEENIGLSMLVLWEDKETLTTDTVYWCCKGRCDDMLQKRYRKPGNNDLWDELVEYTNPTHYIVMLVNYLDSVNKNRHFTAEALAKFRKFLILMFHQVARELTPKEAEIVKLEMGYGMM